jgi:cytochrome c oxidase subunit II
LGLPTGKTLYILALGVACLAGCASAPTPSRHVTVAMKKYAIHPAEIRLKQGETVQFEIVTEDVQHGFDVPDLGISEPVNPGKPAVFIYQATRKGSFKVECGILCGPQHDDMKARLIIE